MWDVAENCWKAEPDDRWSAAQLSERLQLLLSLRATNTYARGCSDFATVPSRQRSSSLSATGHSASFVDGARAQDSSLCRSRSTGNIHELASQLHIQAESNVEPGTSSYPTFDSLATPDLTMDQWSSHSTYDSLMELGETYEPNPPWPPAPPSASGSDEKAVSPEVIALSTRPRLPVESSGKQPVETIRDEESEPWMVEPR